jgi:hypothetical protein
LHTHQAQKQKYRVTLELEVLGDFDPHNLDWEKVFKLEPAEKVISIRGGLKYT